MSSSTNWRRGSSGPISVASLSTTAASRAWASATWSVSAWVSSRICFWSSPSVTLSRLSWSRPFSSDCTIESIWVCELS